ncbi:protein DDI1 homolog 2-like [Watersipora subatra]|uniref:protein DDI1 homolog 2-like n=1 Tax=Watersipora subatra TaxID=2589382 RepID=UPI00355C000D
MKLTITTFKDDLFTLEVPEDIELENVKAYCEVESGLPATDITLVWDGNHLNDDKKTVKQYGIADGDMIFLQMKPLNTASGAPQNNPMAIDFSGIQLPGQGRPQRSAPPNTGRPQVDPYTLREMLLASPHELALLKQNNPPLSDALLSGDPAKFVEVFQRQTEEKKRADAEKMALLTGDPFDPEVQKKIAEAIQQENVNANMEAAMEYSPESFGQVHMLYINCRVNGHAVKAFVDSGAQMTIMSKSCAERCHISHLMDKRWAGIAKGVGVQKILGRVHMCQISINNDHLQCSFSILEDQQMDMLLGLDMLKRHQCCIDLKKNLLLIGTTGTETSFLSEADLPAIARLNRSISASEADIEMTERLLNTTQTGPSTSASSNQQGSSSTTPATPAASSLATSNARGPTPVYPDYLVKPLVDNGFTREQAQQELANTGGDPERALLNLLAKSLNTPRQ